MENDNSGVPAPLPEPVPPLPLVSRTNIFQGPHGIRAGWRLVIYLTLITAAGALVNTLLYTVTGARPGAPSPSILLFSEIANFLIAFAGAYFMSRLEHRSVAAYGLPFADAFRGKFWLGLLFGLLEVSLLVGLIALFGGYSFGPLALHGAQALRWAAYYTLFFLFVGFFEEFFFRGYTQFTLGEGIGFWPAAFLLSALFGVVHLFNPGEGWVGALGVFVVGIFFAFTLYRTGNLWYAVGLHASFDWGETFLYSVPDSGFVFRGHLSNATLHGAKWLTGGTVGPEGSIFCFLTMGLQFLVVIWLFPKRVTASNDAPLPAESVH